MATSNDRKKLVKAYQNAGYFVVFVGDSISDIPAGKIADMFCTTNNGFEEVKENCHFVSSRNGGNGGFAQIIYYVNK